jgi:nitrite reductase/ring-hydroxylating ferredoxin subunit
MMTQEENNLLTQTGRGTPCGELMRRYWQPAALSEELSSDRPLPVQLFGEELILFRDAQGKPALIGRYCAHQGVDMIYGRVEPVGIRCMYHGWLFDTCGKVIVRGGWVEGGEKRMAVGQPAYPCVEAGGLIFTYLGPGEAPALVNLPAPSTLTKCLLDENYLRGILRGNEALPDGAKFFVPNLLAHQGTPWPRKVGCAGMCQPMTTATSNLQLDSSEMCRSLENRILQYVGYWPKQLTKFACSWEFQPMLR